jgi:formylglycine-generating enzyme required for sulfatase activity
MCESDFNLDQVAWYCANCGGRSHDVATKSPNAWGLYDMHGNVAEWCWDFWEPYGGTVTDPIGPLYGIYRHYRGGSWGNAWLWGSAMRRYIYADVGFGDIGFRLARTAP